MVDDLVHLAGELLVDTGDQVLDGTVGIVRKGNRVLQRLLRQGFYRALYG